jgi:hypothetical protein
MNEEQFWSLHTREADNEPILDKAALREKIRQDTEAFLAAGGQIQFVPPGGGSEHHWAMDPEHLVTEREAPKVLGTHAMAFNNGRRFQTLWGQPMPEPQVIEGVEYWRVGDLLALRRNKGGVQGNGKWKKKVVDSSHV